LHNFFEKLFWFYLTTFQKSGAKCLAQPFLKVEEGGFLKGGFLKS